MTMKRRNSNAIRIGDMGCPIRWQAVRMHIMSDHANLTNDALHFDPEDNNISV